MKSSPRDASHCAWFTGLNDKIHGSALISVTVAAAFAALVGCKSRGFNTGKSTSHSASSSAGSCAGARTVRIADYATKRLSCYVSKPGYFGLGGKYETKRDLSPWVPGNAIRFYSHASTGAGFDYHSAFNTIASRNFFDPESAQKLVQHALSGADAPHDLLNGHPALGSPLHLALLDVIRQAKKTLFLDIMLFGGAWGTEIVREMMKQRKLNPGLELVFVRDNVNVFGFSSELDPLWNGLKEFDAKQGDDGLGAVVALDADIDTKTPRGIPGGFGAITGVFGQFPAVRKFLETKLPKLHLEGKSDHSKIVIADAFTETPAVWVASKNPTDNNLLNYDEGMTVRGPAAALAQIAFAPDLRLALAQAQKRAKNPAALPSARVQATVNRWLAETSRLKDPSAGAVACAPSSEGQDVDVRLAENNADDSVRNEEHTILQLVRGAKKNVRMYNMLAYNPGVAEAFADAISRLGADNVRMVIDQALTFTPNLIFHSMVGDSVKFLAKRELEPAAREKLDRWDDSFRWRIGLKSKHFAPPAEKGAYRRIDIDQQQHSKTIIIDDEIVFVGSANFDLITFGGSFREFSMAARTKENDPSRKQVVQAATIFDAIWNDPREAVGTAEIRELRKEDVPDAGKIEIARLFLTGEYKARAGLMPTNIALNGNCQ